MDMEPKVLFKDVIEYIPSLVEQLGEMLSTGPYSKNWKHLAPLMNKTLSYIHSCQKYDNPGMKLLLDWSVQKDTTVEKLQSSLEEIERFDAVEVLKEAMIQRAKKRKTSIPKGIDEDELSKPKAKKAKAPDQMEMDGNDNFVACLSAYTYEKATIPGALAGVTETSVLWDKDELLVYFYSPPKKFPGSAILDIANAWAPHSGITFKECKTVEESDIRVSFEGKSCESLVGNEATHADFSDQPTMNLGGINYTKKHSMIRRYVLHEFGHALGLYHEHQHPNQPIPWDISKTLKYYKATQPDWDDDTVIENVLQPKITGNYSEFDPDSIMRYPIKLELLDTKHPSYMDFVKDAQKWLSWPGELSDTDKYFIKKIYDEKRNPVQDDI